MKPARIVIVVGVAVLAYYLTPVVHEGVEEKLKYRITFGAFKLIHIYGKTRAFFTSSPEDGIVEYSRAFRSSINFIASLESVTSDAPGVTRTITTFDGTTVYVYYPSKRNSSLLPGFIYMHGGGFVIGSAASYDSLTRRIAYELNAVVVSIDYRLAPEYPFPIPYEDCLRATKWFLKNAESYGVDPKRIAIGGDSAGGHFTAGLSQAIYDDKTIPDFKLQIMIYPYTQILDTKYPSYQKYEKEFKNEGVLSTKMISYFISMYLWGKEGALKMQYFIANNHTSSAFKKSALFKRKLSHDLLPDEFRKDASYDGPTPDTVGCDKIWKANKAVFLDERFTPHLRKNFSGLPPAYIQTVGYDPLRDEGYIYYKFLEKDGVDVTWNHYDRAWHGIIHLSDTVRFRMGTKMVDDMLEYTRARL